MTEFVNENNLNPIWFVSFYNRFYHVLNSLYNNFIDVINDDVNYFTVWKVRLTSFSLILYSFIH